MRPMSCVSGIHDRLASSSRARTPLAIASMLVVRLRCVRITPLGSLVDPDENWMNATSSGRGAMLDAGHRDVGHLVQEHRAALEARDAIGEAVLVGVGAQAVEHLALGGERRRRQAGEHAKELGLVLVGVAGRERNGDDAAEHACPERVDERREPVDQHDRVRARDARPRPAGDAGGPSERPRIST